MSKKTKLLIYSGHSETIGGDAKYLFELMDGIDHDKYEIELLTDKSYLFKERARESLLKNLVIRYLDTKPALFKKDYFQSPWGNRIYSRTIRLLSFPKLRYGIHNVLIFYRIFKGKAKEIDIFHFNNGGYPGKAAGIIAIAVAYFLGIKRTIMTVHSVPIKRKWHRISGYISDILISKCCRKIIADSKNIKNELALRRKIPLNRIAVIPCGLNDIKPFSREQSLCTKKRLNLKLNRLTLSIIGNINDSQKGHAILFKALIEVKNKYSDIILLVIGDGKKKKELMALSNRYNLNNSILFLGYRKDIEEINNIIDIAIVPSIDFEAIPYSIKDAMRAGKPVITADIGGCREAVDDGINGLIVPPKNVDLLSKAILQLLENKELRVKMGAVGRKLFLEKFLLSDKIIDHENIYKQLL
jgi:glycosyltransferase involved in cell wall biosynthesis